MSEGLNKLRHVVVLMMENRSFDHMLGFLKKEMPDLDGLTGNETNPDTNGKLRAVQPKAEYQAQLNPDPGHHWEDTNMQIFGNAEGRDDGSPKMQGFIKSYFSKRQDVKHSAAIMNCFDPTKLPVLTTLAKQFAVCDCWFSSLPGPTIPNRLFAHFGESFGKATMSPKFGDKDGHSIFARMHGAGRTARLYYFDEKSASLGFTFILTEQADTFGTFQQFKTDCANGTLPEYSFVEPNYSDHDGMLASDQHPDNNVAAGEQYIAAVYNAIRSNQTLWESTLLLVLYDEHGGTYDHVLPPALNPPDGVTDPTNGFAFDRLGLRVPAIFISPWIPSGTIVHRQYEHASIPASVADFFIGDPAKRFPSVRETRANRFLNDAAALLTLPKVRTDSFFFGKPDKAAPIGAALGARAIPSGKRIGIPVPPSTAYNPQRPINDLQRELLQHIQIRASALKLKTKETGKDLADIRTSEDAANYIQTVVENMRISKDRARPKQAKGPTIKRKPKAAARPGRALTAGGKKSTAPKKGKNR